MFRGLLPFSFCLAGCIDSTTEIDSEGTEDGEKLHTEEAVPVTVEATALDRTNYDLERNATFRLTQTIEVSDESYQIEAQNELAEYSRTVELPRFGQRDLVRFTAVSTPEVRVFSQEVNFVDQVRAEALGDRLQTGYDRVEIDDDPVGSQTISPFGYEVSADQYEGVAEHANRAIEVELYTAKVFHESNYVTMVGLYPRPLADREQENVIEMMESVELVE